ncbi:RNA-binding protein NOB1, partial [Paragonimus westermani]
LDMAVHTDKPIPHLVVDSVAFLKRARLETFGSKIYTTAQVIGELRDPKIRVALKCLPYKLHLLTPSKDSTRHVSEVAKKTGDFSVLSPTDMGLIAVTYELHRELVGDPIIKPVVPLPTNLGQQARAAIAFDSEAENSGDDSSVFSNEEPSSDDQQDDVDLPTESDWITEHNFEEKSFENFGFGNDNISRPTKRTDTYFCPSCAQANLRRIPVTLKEDGQLQFHFSRRFVKSLRGTQQPIRRPKGGKHADEPIYCPDQRLPDRRPAKPKHPDVQPIATNGLLDELTDDLEGLCDFGVDAPVAFPLHDINTRAARVGIRSDHQIAPRSWFRTTVEHGLKPTRGTAHISKPRTGNKKKNKSKY